MHDENGASVVGASVVGASVVGASVVGASVVGASVVGASVVGASVVGASVVGASVVGASVVVSMKQVKFKFLFSSCPSVPSLQKIFNVRKNEVNRTFELAFCAWYFNMYMYYILKIFLL